MVTVAGLAASETVGAGAETVTVADWAADPPAPVQVKIYLVVVESPPVLRVPLVDSGPVQPPEALQDVASDDDQVNVEVPPLFTVVGFASKVTAGAAAVTETVADCAAVPPAPVQVSV